MDKRSENLQKWNHICLSGYLVLGSNGETVLLNEIEKIKVIETGRECIPKSKIMMVGTGRESTQETISFTNRVLGADYAMVITPAFFKGSMKSQALHDHFMAIAESSKIGVLLYNVPQFTGVNVEPELVAILSEHPNIFGIKDSSGNIEQLSRIIDMSRKGFAVFGGSATVFFPALCVGAAGGILAAACLVPIECVEIQNLFNDGKMGEARALQKKLTPLAIAMTTKYGIGGLKMAMDLVDYYGGTPRAPLKQPSQEAKEELNQLLAQF